MCPSPASLNSVESTTLHYQKGYYSSYQIFLNHFYSIQGILSDLMSSPKELWMTCPNFTMQKKKLCDIHAGEGHDKTVFVIGYTYRISYTPVHYIFPLTSQFCVSIKCDLKQNVKVKLQWIYGLRTRHWKRKDVQQKKQFGIPLKHEL